MTARQHSTADTSLEMLMEAVTTERAPSCLIAEAPTDAEPTRPSTCKMGSFSYIGTIADIPAAKPLLTTLVYTTRTPEPTLPVFDPIAELPDAPRI